MTDHANFLSHAWQVVARAFVNAGAAANIDLHPATLSKAVKRCCLAELRRLTVLIRRLIFLMAQAGPVDATPVILRCYQLINVVKHCERRAKCLTRTLQRWQAAGEAKPYVPPAERKHRMSYDLGLIAGILPVLLNRAMQSWPDTG